MFLQLCKKNKIKKTINKTSIAVESRKVLLDPSLFLIIIIIIIIIIIKIIITIKQYSTVSEIRQCVITANICNLPYLWGFKTGSCGVLEDIQYSQKIRIRIHIDVCTCRRIHERPLLVPSIQTSGHPRSMDHPCGRRSLTTLTHFVDPVSIPPLWPPLICEEKFCHRSKRIFEIFLNCSLMQLVYITLN